MMSVCFSRKSFSYSVFGKSQTLSRSILATRGNSTRFQILKLSCALDDHWVLELNCTMMSFIVHRSREILLQTCSISRERRESSCNLILHLRSSGNRFCETIGLFDKELPNMHDAEVHVFSDSVLCMGQGAMNEPEVKFTKRWNDFNEQYSRFTPPVTW